MRPTLLLLAALGCRGSGVRADAGQADAGGSYGSVPDAASTPARVTRAAEMVGGWSFRKGCSPTRVEDLVRGSPAVGSGEVACVKTEVGEAASFDGKSARYEIADRPAYHLTTAWSVTAWVKPRRTDKLQTIVNKWYARDAYMLGIDRQQYQVVVAAPGEPWGHPFTVSAPAAVGVWTHVAGVYDGVDLVLYVDGVVANRGVFAGRVQDSARPLVIGSHPERNGYDGLIDEVRLYDGVMKPAEVAALAEQDALRVAMRAHEVPPDPERKRLFDADGGVPSVPT